jgi:hypothetical protein
MKKCEDCLGFGSFIVPDDVESSLASEQDKYLICKKCHGSGKVKRPYSDCGGYQHDLCPVSHAGIFDPCSECIPLNKQKLYCKHCTEEVIGQNNLARVYYKLDDDSIEEVYLVHEKCVGAYVYSKDPSKHKTYEKSSGMFKCAHCTKEIQGKAHVSYTLDSDYVDEIIVLHEDCVRPYKLNKKNLTHKCPKCNGSGNKSTDVLSLWTKDDGSMELVWASQMYHKPGRYNSGKFEAIKEKTKPCDLCDGEGYLAKEPIPVITEWRKAP